ncbi:MAG: hypothetical protein P4L34_09700 [Paludibacter sp.]|nr:hypothetical protein [Paludibacter sp.]
MLSKLYISKVLPFKRKFISFEIYRYILADLEQIIAESFQKKNKYEALDVIDFKYVKAEQIKFQIIKIFFNKFYFGNEIELLYENAIRFLIIDKVKYQLIYFDVGSLPEIDLNYNKIIIFMFQLDFLKVFYCGKLVIEKDLTNDFKQVFYEKYCLEDSQYFIDFNSLSV